MDAEDTEEQEEEKDGGGACGGGWKNGLEGVGFGSGRFVVKRVGLGLVDCGS